MTGSTDKSARNAKTTMDVHDNASDDDVSFNNVVPACMATNEGGATP